MMRQLPPFLLAGFLILQASATPVAAGEPVKIGPDHWAYQAISTLHKKGLADGYPAAWFEKNQPVTRHEAALLVASATRRLTGPDAASLKRLEAEFKDELTMMEVRMSGLEGEVDALGHAVDRERERRGLRPRMRPVVTVEDRIRYEGNTFHTTNPGVADSAQVTNRMRVNMHLDIDGGDRR